MSPLVLVSLGLIATYLLGAIPFGYLIGRLKGVNLFEAGSGNIGATNAGRVLGRRVGILVFVLDFLKGALPVAFLVPLLNRLDPDCSRVLGSGEALQTAAAAATFLGHLFPVYLRFSGGKGVATAAGALCVLVPGPTAVGLFNWLVLLLATRAVSAASIGAALSIVIARFLSEPQPWQDGNAIITAFLLAAATFTTIKHRTNLTRLWNGTESRITPSRKREVLLRCFHAAAVGIWFGGSIFFNYAVALPTFPWFNKIVHAGPSDRTANFRIIADDASPQEKDQLASALAGSVVGPIFPRYFAMQGVCGFTALLTAWAWRLSEPERIHRIRFWVILFACLLVALGWPISQHVSYLRIQRFSPIEAVEMAARAAFVPWHLASLLLSLIVTILAGMALVLVGVMPAGSIREPGGNGAVAT